MVAEIMSGDPLRRAVLIAGLLALSASPLMAQELPSSTAFPGSFWLASGDVGPAERGNVVGQAALEQGVTVWQRKSWFLVPYFGVTLMTDSAGYEWNNRHPTQAGLKVVRRVPGGVVQAAVGMMFEIDPLSGAGRHPGTYVSYWAGWAAEGAAQRGSPWRGFPGHLSATSGFITGRDPQNWMTIISGQQGVAILKNRVISLVPYGAGIVSFDTERRVWENRVTLDGGVKLVRPFVGGVVEGGVAERRQYSVITGDVDSSPVAYVNLWIGWNARAVGRR
jgi:hypothetical protein